MLLKLPECGQPDDLALLFKLPDRPRNLGNFGMTAKTMGCEFYLVHQ